MKIYKILSALTFIAILGSFIPGTASAQVSASVQAQINNLTKLQEQVRQLQLQLQTVQTQQQQIVSELVSTLKQGSKGDQVSALQALLAADSDIYPEELITGFFGKATEKAVKKFQSKHGLDSLGIVGPLTRGKLNAMLKNTPISFEASLGASTTGTSVVANGGQPCAIVPPGHLIAPGWLRKNGGIAPIVPPCQKLPPGIAKKIGLVTPTSTPPAPTSTPDTTVPVISGIIATPATTTATITWTTNELSDSQVNYGTTTAYGSSTVLNTTNLTFHSQGITGLLPGTVYHFKVISKDAAGNIASSSDQTFTTTALDLTAPVISGIGVAAASGTATVSWSTNESSTSKVYYATSTPVSLTSTSTIIVMSTSTVTSHSLNLLGLTASSTYYFIVESADVGGNVATSTTQSFVTTP